MSNRYDFITNEADERPSANAKFGDVLYCKDTGNEYLYDGTAWQEYKMRYKDLGLVIDAVNVAVGATVLSAVYANSMFNVSANFGVTIGINSLKTSIALLSSEQNPPGDFSAITNILSDSTSFTTTRKNVLYNPMTATTVTTGVFGKYVKFAFRNNDTVIQPIAKVNVQLIKL